MPQVVPETRLPAWPVPPAPRGSRLIPAEKSRGAFKHPLSVIWPTNVRHTWMRITCACTPRQYLPRFFSHSPLAFQSCSYTHPPTPNPLPNLSKQPPIPTKMSAPVATTSKGNSSAGGNIVEGDTIVHGAGSEVSFFSVASAQLPQRPMGP
jgi:hypothetical protein